MMKKDIPCFMWVIDMCESWLMYAMYAMYAVVATENDSE